MKNIGLACITVGFLLCAYLAVLDELDVGWTAFLPSLLLGFVGVALVHIGSRKEAFAEERVSTNISILEQSLASVVEKVGRLNAEKGSIFTYDMAGRIDALLLDDLNAFVDARETISHIYGLTAYASVMSHYAGGERYLNRVWSASVDGYIDEVNTYLEKAYEQFSEAQYVLRSLER